MTVFIIIGLAALFVCIFISRSISEKALGTLSEEQQEALLDQFARFKRYNQIPFILAILIYLFVSSFKPINSDLIFLFLFMFFIVSLIASHTVISKKLNVLKLPRKYVKQYNMSRYVYISGFLICTTFLLLDFLG